MLDVCQLSSDELIYVDVDKQERTPLKNESQFHALPNVWTYVMFDLCDAR